MNRHAFRALALAFLAIIAARAIEESYQTGVVGAAVSRWDELSGRK